jgi:hypothetical protein
MGEGKSCRRKGQVTYEFLFLFFILAAAFTVWTAFTADTQARLHDEHRARLLEDLAFQVQDDIYTAVQMQEGFSRTLSYPATIDGRSYVIAIDAPSGEQAYALLACEGMTAKVSLPPVRVDAPLQPLPATNTIVKSGGLVIIN